MPGCSAFVSLQLQEMPAPQGDDGEGQGARIGVYLGAYAWLEDLRPAPSRSIPVELPPDLEQAFGQGAPIVRDPRNGGYIHAPSLPQARTAAVLRSGYLANATPSNPETLAVNLSSERVRLALSLLEGIRNGQSLGALLGYRFERDLHDRHGFAEVDQFIYPLRKAFPLAGDLLAPTKTDPDVPIDAIEARNVLDGRKLVDADPHDGQRNVPVRARRPARRRRRARRPRSLPPPTRCSTFTTRSPTSRLPKACTRLCRATSTASPAPSTRTRPARSRPSRRSCRRRRSASG